MKAGNECRMGNRNRQAWAGLWFAVALAAQGAVAADGWVAVTRETDPGLPSNEIQFLKELPDGSLWVGTLAGVTRWRDGTFAPLKDAKGAVRNLRAWDVLACGPGQYLLGHGNGCGLIDGTAWVETLPGHSVAPLVRVASNTVWAIGKHLSTERNTVFQYADRAWKPVAKFEGMQCTDMVRLADGSLWISVEGNGVFRVDPARDLAAAAHHLSGLDVTCVALDSQRRVWCGTWGRGASLYDGQKWTSMCGGEKSAILSVAEDKAGNFWLATSQNGIWRYDGKAWFNDLKDEGSISVLRTTSDGGVWVSSQHGGGLRRWNGKSWDVAIDTPQAVTSFCETRAGALWVSSPLNGLYRMQK